MSTTFAIIAAGGMGSAMGQRLVEHGARVITSMSGRSSASRERAAGAGMIDVGDEGLVEADIFLSVVPPDRALPLARHVCRTLQDAVVKPLYVDCNAVAPDTAREIAAVVEAAGLDFIDAGIIGLPPSPGKPGPAIYVSGPHAQRARVLSEYGLRTEVLDAPNGAASVLKMSYAGITKGLIAIAATMALASKEAGAGEALVTELSRSQPQLLASFSRTVPDMLGKAGRWVPEMGEIANFVGPGIASAEAYRAFAALYDQVAADQKLRDVLGSFYVAPESGNQER